MLLIEPFAMLFAKYGKGALQIWASLVRDKEISVAFPSVAKIPFR
jgi:hypothetical protein